MSRFVRYLLSSVGAKTIVALTGLGLTLFVIGHLLGNLQVFLPKEYLNKYAEFLQTSPELLWPARIGLLTIFIVHVVMSIRVRWMNAAARPQPYAVHKTIQATPGSRTMLISGLVLLAFIAYHLAHFTVGLTDPANFKAKNLEVLHPAIVGTNPQSGQTVELPAETRPDVYWMMIKGFRNPWVSTFYILSMVFLALHLSHGVPSMFQSLGLGTNTWASPVRKVGIAVAILIALGNILIPLTILLGLVGRDVPR